MKLIRTAIILATLTSLSACGAVDGLVSRNIAPDAGLLGEQPDADAQFALSPSYDVVAVNVSVPKTLKVSEANGYKPRADIVWHGDPYGDRYSQIDTLVTAALTQGVAEMHGSRKVVLDVEMTRFHALTELTRYTFGGEHEVWMNITVRDAETGAVIEPARRIGFNARAAGGEEAVRNESHGITQKVVISNALIELIQHELSGA